MSNPSVFIRDINGNLVDTSSVSVPANRNFRAAWVRTGPVITVDMEAAREDFREKARAAVQAKLKSDVLEAFIDAELNDDASAKATLRQMRNAAKAIDSHPSIEAAQTPEDLVSLWKQNEGVLGPSPYV